MSWGKRGLVRHQDHYSFCGTSLIIRHCSDTQTCTHSYTPNQSPLIGEIAFKGRGKKNKIKCFTLFFLRHKIKLSHALGSIVFPLTLHQKVVRCCPITGADKSRGEFNYISLKCERFFFQSKSPSVPVWTFMFNLFFDIGPLWQYQDWLAKSKKVYLEMGLAGYCRSKLMVRFIGWRSGIKKEKETWCATVLQLQVWLNLIKISFTLKGQN